jgi:nucleotide-binding universal stress UspA family protein
MTAPRILLVIADETPEMLAALRYAALRAASMNARIALLNVTEPTEMQLWRAVEKRVESETARKAEALLQKLGRIGHELSGHPVVYYRAAGDVRAEVLRLIASDPSISVLVLAAANKGKGPGPLVNYVSGQGLSRMRIPFVIVPGDYVDSEDKDIPITA